jgi:hypothetical protein
MKFRPSFARDRGKIFGTSRSICAPLLSLAVLLASDRLRAARQGAVCRERAGLSRYASTDGATSKGGKLCGKLEGVRL